MANERECGEIGVQMNALIWQRLFDYLVPIIRAKDAEPALSPSGEQATYMVPAGFISAFETRPLFFSWKGLTRASSVNKSRISAMRELWDARNDGQDTPIPIFSFHVLYCLSESITLPFATIIREVNNALPLTDTREMIKRVGLRSQSQEDWSNETSFVLQYVYSKIEQAHRPSFFESIDQHFRYLFPNRGHLRGVDRSRMLMVAGMAHLCGVDLASAIEEAQEEWNRRNTSPKDPLS